MPLFIVRQATHSDVDVIAPLFDGYRQFYGKETEVEASRAFIEARLRLSESVVFIAETTEKAIGFAQLYPSFSSVSMKKIFILNDLFVTAAGRNKGAGKALIQSAAEYAAKIGAVRISLSTAVNNTAAQGLYESAGWQRDESFYVYNLPINASQVAQPK